MGEVQDAHLHRKQGVRSNWRRHTQGRRGVTLVSLVPAVSGPQQSHGRRSSRAQQLRESQTALQKVAQAGHTRTRARPGLRGLGEARAQ